MARKSAIEPKPGQLPGYSDEGFTPRGADCIITYRVSSVDDPERVADLLWHKMKKGTEEQRYSCGPRIVGNELTGYEVEYSVYTVYRGDAEEEDFRFNLQARTGGVVTMSKSEVPPAPAPIPGIDAPAQVA